MRIAERDHKVKQISGRIMRSTAFRSGGNNPAKVVRSMVESAVKSGLMYRSREDDAALAMIDVDEAKSLVAEWNAALEDEGGGDREIAAGQALAEFVAELAHDAQLAYGDDESVEARL